MKLNEQKMIPFITFKGDAEEAMKYYIASFPNAKQISLDFFTDGDRGEVGKVMNGTFEAMGMKIMVMDMQAEYWPGMTWAINMLIHCETEEEFDLLFDNLSKDGVVMMGPEPIGKLRKVAWVTDKYGVTWQLVWQ